MPHVYLVSVSLARLHNSTRSDFQSFCLLSLRSTLTDDVGIIVRVVDLFIERDRLTLRTRWFPTCFRLLFWTIPFMVTGIPSALGTRLGVQSRIRGKLRKRIDKC